MNARDLALRTTLLVGGLTLYGTSMAMMITGGLGLNPWDVFHQGWPHGSRSVSGRSRR